MVAAEDGRREDGGRCDKEEEPEYYVWMYHRQEARDVSCCL
jgi:hypothetical protein